MKTALVTGSSGFIGYFTATALLRAGWPVVGVDREGLNYLFGCADFGATGA